MRFTKAVYSYRHSLSGDFSDFHTVNERLPLLHEGKQDAEAAPIRL
jgi:hypothetical protein